MNMFGYGEDAFTLWALKNRLALLLEQLNDSSSSYECKIFFRPSFGRKGGGNSAQFGEFDFILLSKCHLYLGESKWHRSSEKRKDGIVQLREEQLKRHEIFKFYVREWAFGDYAVWDDFEKTARINLDNKKSRKPVAPARSLLASNLQTVLRVIKRHFQTLPPIKNVLLFLHDGKCENIPLKNFGFGFEVATIDCSEGCFENFIML